MVRRSKYAEVAEKSLRILAQVVPGRLKYPLVSFGYSTIFLEYPIFVQTNTTTLISVYT